MLPVDSVALNMPGGHTHKEERSAWVVCKQLVLPCLLTWLILIVVLL